MLSENEIFESIFKNDNVHIEKIISAGQVTPDNNWLSQEQNEWVILLQGTSEMEFDDGKKIRLYSGDYIFIPANTGHKVTYTSSNPVCIWLAIHIK